MRKEKSLNEQMTQSKAPVKAYDAIEINASQETIWGFLSDLQKWYLWKEVTPERRTGPKWNVGTQFRWKRGIFTINAEIVEIEPPFRVLWAGRTLGIKAFHYWVLKEITSKTFVENYEEWFGIVPRLFKERSQRRVENSLRRELEGLKRAAESL